VGSEMCIRDRYSGQVTVGIRPEDITISRDGIPAKVMVVEPLGHEFIITLMSENVSYKARIFGKSAPSMGDDIHIAIDPDKIMMFVENKRIWPIK